MEHTANNAETSPSVWVTGYVDQSRKCGYGFLLSDRSVSVGFNDGTSMALEPHGVAFDYINRARPSSITREAAAGADNKHQEDTIIRTTYTLKDFPRELARKVDLLKDFRSYVHKLANYDEVGQASDGDNDCGTGSSGAAASMTQKLTAGTAGEEPLVFVEQFRRTPQMVLFRLSNRTVQVRQRERERVCILRKLLCVCLLLSHAMPARL